MKKYNKILSGFSKAIEQLETLFIDSIETADSIFDSDAFISPVYERKVTKPQKTIYDPLMQAIALNIGNKDILIKNSDKIKNEKYHKMWIDEDETQKFFDGRDNQAPTVRERIKYFDELLKKYSE